MKNNIFQKARVKLTIYYICIMALILLAFSSVLIFTVESKIREGFQGRILITENEQDPFSQASDEIEYIIYMIDGILLVIIGFSSYFLAGKTLNPIKKSLESQKKFTADASHDLRTPLAIMTTESEVTLQNKNATTTELRNSIESNLEETKKMTRLVQDLLLISSGDNGSRLNSFSEIDLYNYINKLISKLKLQAEEKSLTINIGEYKKILARVNEDNFQRVILNILQNAIKYTKQGSINVVLNEESKKVTITITDTGVGISQKDLPYVFDRFYRAEHSRSDNTSSGLGLPIAKLIVEEHKGSIEIESEVDGGTSVIIQIPKI